jgi:hypothetical protein
MICKNILEIILAKHCFGNISKTPETHPSMIANARQYIDPVNAPSGIETNQSTD